MDGRDRQPAMASPVSKGRNKAQNRTTQNKNRNRALKSSTEIIKQGQSSFCFLLGSEILEVH